MEIPNNFQTSAGRSIPVLDGYHASHKTKERVFHLQDKPHSKLSTVENSLRARVLRNMSVSGVTRQTKRVQQTLFQKPNGSYLKDAFEYGMVIDYLSSIGINGPWENLLDIGGAEGYIARLFKAQGRAKSAVCVDVIENMSSTSKMWLHHYAYKRTKLTSGPQGLLKKLPNYFGYYPPRCGTYLNIKFKKNPSLDEHIVGDALSITGHFDLVTGFLCLEYFDLDELFPKVHSLLNPGGIFAFLVNYWWWPVNSTAIVGHFPYAAQRLDIDDFHRYLSEFHPNSADEYLKRFQYFHKGKQRPTVRNYLEFGVKHGFEPCGYRRLMPRQGGEPKTPVPPSILKNTAEFKFSDVLSDVAEFRSDVSEIDLNTAFALCVFQKK